jgi:hypothetical protein
MVYVKGQEKGPVPYHVLLDLDLDEGVTALTEKCLVIICLCILTVQPQSLTCMLLNRGFILPHIPSLGNEWVKNLGLSRNSVDVDPEPLSSFPSR